LFKTTTAVNMTFIIFVETCFCSMWYSTTSWTTRYMCTKWWLWDNYLLLARNDAWWHTQKHSSVSQNRWMCWTIGVRSGEENMAKPNID